MDWGKYEEPRIANIWAEIWTQRLQNTKWECYPGKGDVRHLVRIIKDWVSFMRVQFLTALAVRDMKPYGQVEVYPRLRGTCLHPFDQGRRANQESCLLFASFTHRPRSLRQCFCTKHLNTSAQLYGITSQQKEVFFTVLILFDESMEREHSKKWDMERIQEAYRCQSESYRNRLWAVCTDSKRKRNAVFFKR